jgi:hypothetical protein
MQDLTPVGLTQDGKKLVLISSSGEEFAVLVDTRLRAAMRGDNTRLAQLEMKMESVLRPRDIQARIRAGESPEKVATAAQTSVEAIMPFAQPVLDERAHVASTAMSASVRRRGSGSSTAAGTLDDTAQIFLQSNGLHDEDVIWDAWRRPDGVWLLVAKYQIDGKEVVAEFTHDLRGRYVVAENDAARQLTGELAPAKAAERSLEFEPATPQRRPLAAVPPAEELPLGDDALDLVREPESTEPVPSQPASAESAPADALPTDHEPTLPDALPQVADEATPAPEPPERPKKRRGRSSVPSWDEIMFGGGGQKE